MVIDESPSPATVSMQYPEQIHFLFGVELAFLIASLACGGFRFEWWSMLDTSFFLLALGVLGLVPVLEGRLHAVALQASILLYLAGLFDSALNIVLSGIWGWHFPV